MDMDEGLQDVTEETVQFKGEGRDQTFWTVMTPLSWFNNCNNRYPSSVSEFELKQILSFLYRVESAYMRNGRLKVIQQEKALRFVIWKILTYRILLRQVHAVTTGPEARFGFC